MKESKYTDEIERLNRVLYIRRQAGPDFERAYLCAEDGEPDMCLFATVTWSEAEIFKAAISAVEAAVRADERAKSTARI